jgi:hypothetical protein
MSERRCPVHGCSHVLGTTRNGNPYLLCPRHYQKLPMRSIKAKAGRRGKKKNGVAFSDLLGVVKRLKSEHALALTTIEKLSIEKSAMHRQLQEVLA